MEADLKKYILLGKYRISDFGAVTISPVGFVRGSDEVAEVPFHMDKLRAKAHLELIKEAFEVFQETGQTPRELCASLAKIKSVENHGHARG